MRSPYEYQIPVIKYIKETEHPAVFLEMRLGKTFCVIRALKDAGYRRILIVCPKPVIDTWREELEAECILNHAFYTSAELNKYFLSPDHDIQLPSWVIMNYEAVTRVNSEWLDELFDVVVLDESVKIKSPEATSKDTGRPNLTRFFVRNFRDVKKRMILSGNPAPNSPLEYFPQFQFLRGRWMNSDNFYEFRHRYFNHDLQGYQWWIRAKSKEVLKIELHKDAYILTRKQAGVANKKVYEKRTVELPPKVQKLYRQMLKEFFVNLPSGESLQTKYVVAQLSYLQQLASGHIRGEKISGFKFRELMSLLDGELKGEPVVIWSRFKYEIAEIHRRLQKAGKRSAMYSGSIPLSQRKKNRLDFQAGKLDYLVMQTSTGKFGLNLSRSSTAIYFSNSLVPDDRVQSELRIEHNDKKEPLLFVDLVTQNSVDLAIMKNLIRKKEQAAYFLGDVVEELREQNERLNRVV